MVRLQAYGGQGVECSGLNKKPPLIGSYIWMFSYQGAMLLLEKDWEACPCWSGRVLVGGSAPLVVGFEVSKAKANASISLFLLPLDCDEELSATCVLPRSSQHLCACVQPGSPP